MSTSPLLSHMRVAQGLPPTLVCLLVHRVLRFKSGNRIFADCPMTSFARMNKLWVF